MIGIALNLDYLKNKNLGYDKNNVIYFPSEGKIAESQEIFISEIKNIPGIIDASSALHAPMGNGGGIKCYCRCLSP